MTSSGGGEGSLQTRLRQGDSAGELQVDQAAEAAAFLGLVIGENIGEIMVEKRIHEPLEDRAAIGLRLLAEADPLPSPSIEDLATSGIVLVLDQITDPHNFGAILRTAAAFAVAAIVTTARHSPEATGVLAKSASGALELVPIASVQNLARAIAALKERGFLVVGLDGAAPDDLAASELSAPLALVLGAEGKGLRQGTRAQCDRLARLDLPGAIKTLNVSNAAALALYIARRAIA